jgi:molecular chaperone DnaK
MAAFIGVDLGTTFSAAAHIAADGRPEILPNSEGERITPSVIWFGTDPPTVGRLAKEEQKAGAPDVASFFKRSMGDPNYSLSFHGKDYNPIDLSCLVLKKIKADCETSLGRPVTHAVITVPAYFNNPQREATLEAGRRAGLDVLRIINEPTAAAQAYGVQKSATNDTFLVYDLGGGTFDVSLVNVGPDDITVLAMDGNNELGGKDWDDRVARFLASRFREEHGFDPLDSNAAFQDLLVACEQAKQQLSSRASVKVPLDFNKARGVYELSRDKFEELTADLMEETRHLTERVLTEAALSWSHLGGVLLVGGSTRMPMVKTYVERMSGKPARSGVNVDEAVALGAAVQAAIDIKAVAPKAAPRMMPGARCIQDIIPHSLGVVLESPDRSRYINVKIIPKNSKTSASMMRPSQLRTRAQGGNELEVYLTQGESDDPTACTILGKYCFSDIAHAQAGLAVLEIYYDHDRSGVVNVSARDRSTGKELPMRIEPVPADMSWLGRPPAPEAKPVHLTAYLAFDLSGSMSGTPLKEAQKAAREFLHQSDLSHASLGLVAFADSVAIAVKACQDGRKLENAISGMTIGSVGGGNDASPFADIRRLLKKVSDPRYIIVLTDGVWSYQQKAAAEAKACHADGIEIIAIGFGGADKRFLEEISSAAMGSFYTSLEGLVETFGKIAQTMTEGLAGGLRKKER